MCKNSERTAIIFEYPIYWEGKNGICVFEKTLKNQLLMFKNHEKSSPV